MFPIKDHNPSERTPYVTIALIALNILIFLGTMTPTGEWFWVRFALYPGAVTQGYYIEGLLTHMFLHAGFMHIAGNMLFLWVFGDNLEDQLGHFGFLAYYIACGLAAAIAQIGSDPTSTIPMIGASGAVAGIMGGYLLLFPKARVNVLFIFIIFFKVFVLPAWIVLGAWAALQLFGGFTTPTAGGGVAYWAHIGGFVAGALLIVPLFMKLGGAAYWSRTHGHPPHPEAEVTKSRIPIVRRR